MRVVRVHNPSSLRATRKGKKTMAATKRKRHVTRRRHRASNPHKRRHRRRAVANTRRRHNPAGQVTRRRHHRRRHNPSALRVGEIIKDAIYGAGGAVLTRVGAGAIQGFLPGVFTTSSLAAPIAQAGIAVIPVRWLGKKFLGQRQGDLMMLGGLVSAGLALADVYLPNIQSQLAGFLPVSFAPQAALPPAVQAQIAQGAAQGAAQAAAMAGYGDVEDVDMIDAGFGDVEELPNGIWG